MINFNDKRINIDDVNHFKEFGWVNINLNLSKQTIESALKGLKEMRRTAIKSKYPFGRVYFDHIQDFKVVEHLHEDFDINNSVLNIPRINRQKLGDRLLNSLNYFLPIYNLYNTLRKKESYKKLSKFGKPDIFSNTHYQKEK